MSGETEFTSRTGTINRDIAAVYGFVSDIRNFNRLIPEDTVLNWVADADSCSFDISNLGSAKINIAERVPMTLVKFEGVAIQNTGFRLWVQLKEAEPSVTKFRLVIKADLNPFYKLMVSTPITNYLERLVGEIEKFEDWNGAISDTQPL
jgi:carbon monoxide dehydrogenase subunit G